MSKTQAQPQPQRSDKLILRLCVKFTARKAALTETPDHHIATDPHRTVLAPPRPHEGPQGHAFAGATIPANLGLTGAVHRVADLLIRHPAAIKAQNTVTSASKITDKRLLSGCYPFGTTTRILRPDGEMRVNPKPDTPAWRRSRGAMRKSDVGAMIAVQNRSPITVWVRAGSAPVHPGPLS